jgi:hypothetical protein
MEKEERIKELGSLELEKNKEKHRIKLLTIIGEIEGHDAVSGNTQTFMHNPAIGQCWYASVGIKYMFN